eukprot:PLAT4216.1.p2 GENE.PLAT4216.1~~PLAT4216.1.p2  ORF type:complete len:433 (+),score=209.55 PLAT4216.1:43-1299(+)
MAEAAHEPTPAEEYKEAGFATRALHVGQSPDPISGAVTVPISLASTFAQPSPGIAMGGDAASSWGKGFEYSRTGNPTRGAYEACLASLEGAAYAVAFASGSSAIAACIHLLESGDHFLCVDDVYGGSQRYFRRIVKPTMGIDCTFLDMSDMDVLDAAFTERTKLVWLETPTNPTLKITDIAAVAEVAHKHGAILVVDNTFMTPYFQQPLKLGADLVVHSVTKYINGHSDVVGGIIALNDESNYERLRFIQNGLGAVPSPFDCFMTLRGIKTLAVRMDRHESNATAVAKMLEAHDLVDRVIYPGLPSHPQYELAKKQMSGFGGMITFFVKGSIDDARVFLENVKIFTLAESLGAVESLAESPAVMTHASVPPEVRAELGLSDTLIRLSVGIENEDDLLADVSAALDAVGAAAAARAAAE